MPRCGSLKLPPSHNSPKCGRVRHLQPFKHPCSLPRLPSCAGGCPSRLNQGCWRRTMHGSAGGHCRGHAVGGKRAGESTWVAELQRIGGQLGWVGFGLQKCTRRGIPADQMSVWVRQAALMASAHRICQGGTLMSFSNAAKCQLIQKITAFFLADLAGSTWSCRSCWCPAAPTSPPSRRAAARLTSCC